MLLPEVYSRTVAPPAPVVVWSILTGSPAAASAGYEISSAPVATPTAATPAARPARSRLRLFDHRWTGVSASDDSSVSCQSTSVISRTSLRSSLIRSSRDRSRGSIGKAFHAGWGDKDRVPRVSHCRHADAGTRRGGDPLFTRPAFRRGREISIATLQWCHRATWKNHGCCTCAAGAGAEPPSSTRSSARYPDSPPSASCGPSGMPIPRTSLRLRPGGESLPAVGAPPSRDGTGLGLRIEEIASLRDEVARTRHLPRLYAAARPGFHVAHLGPPRPTATCCRASIAHGRPRRAAVSWSTRRSTRPKPCSSRAAPMST